MREEKMSFSQRCIASACGRVPVSFCAISQRGSAPRLTA